ncbi:hypothetical protein SCA6_002589 [Theobroma cacao]
MLKSNLCLLIELYISSIGFTVSSWRISSSAGYVSFSSLPFAFSLQGSNVNKNFCQMPRTAWISGLVQTALYADFFYYYIKSWKNHEKLKLPA